MHCTLRSIGIVFTVLLGPLVWAQPAGSADVTIETIALTGDTAPGTPGRTSRAFFTPVLNASGEVAFRAFLDSSDSSNDFGLWTGSASSLTLAAREGDAAPGTSGRTFLTFGPPVLNAPGEIAFLGFLDFSDISNDEGIWVGSPGSLALAAREGNAAPGTIARTFRLFDFPVLSASGEVASRALLDASDMSNDLVVWAGSPGSLALAAREGDAAPGTSGRTFKNFSEPVLNAAGEVAFRAFLDASDSGSDEGIWAGSPGSLALAAREGDAAPGTSGRTFRTFGPPVLNASGEVAFRASLDASDSSSDSGLWAGSPGSLVLAAREGDAAPGTFGRTFRTFNSPVLNAAGEIAVRAFLDTSDFSSDSGLWAGSPGSLALVAREGDAAPGTSGRTFRAFGRPVMNAAGVVAFVALLDTSDSSNDAGLWAGRPGSLTLVAREGDTLEGRTIAGVFGLFSGSGNEDGRRSGLNDDGQVAFRANFTNGDEGIFLATLEGNQAPVADAGIDGTVACSAAAGTEVTLDGSGSSDPDDDPLTFTWTGPFPEGGGTVNGENPTVTLPLGTSTIALVVNDGELESEPDTVDIAVTVQVHGFLSPLSALVSDGSEPPLPDKTFKRNRTLALKLQLFCGSEILTDADVNAPLIASILKTGDAPLDLETTDLDSRKSNDGGVLFRFADTIWIYNLGSKSLDVGTWEIGLDMPDERRFKGRFVLR